MEKIVNSRRMRQLKLQNNFDSPKAFDEIESTIARNHLYRPIWLVVIGSTGLAAATPGWAAWPLGQ
jgi:hypothetical protein